MLILWWDKNIWMYKSYYNVYIWGVLCRGERCTYRRILHCNVVIYLKVVEVVLVLKTRFLWTPSLDRLFLAQPQRSESWIHNICYRLTHYVVYRRSFFCGYNGKYHIILVFGPPLTV